MELPDGKNRRFERRHVAANDDLQRVDQLRSHDKCVHSFVRHSAMRAHAIDIHAEPVRVRHARTRFDRDRASFYLAPDMRAINRVDAVEHARLDESARTAGNLFRRLEQNAHFAFERIACFAQHADCTEHHRDVTVVTASMHHALDGRSVRSARLLVDRQGINVSAQRDTTLRHAVLAVGAWRGAFDSGNNTRFRRTLVGHAKRIELTRNLLGRPELFEPQLGMCMEFPALFYDVRLPSGAQFFNALRDGRICHTPQPLCSVRTGQRPARFCPSSIAKARPLPAVQRAAGRRCGTCARYAARRLHRSTLALCGDRARYPVTVVRNRATGTDGSGSRTAPELRKRCRTPFRHGPSVMINPESGRANGGANGR